MHQTRNLEAVGLEREVWELVERSGRQTGRSGWGLTSVPDRHDAAVRPSWSGDITSTDSGRQCP